LVAEGRRERRIAHDHPKELFGAGWVSFLGSPAAKSKEGQGPVGLRPGF
jgi:hypothetical protein